MCNADKFAYRTFDEAENAIDDMWRRYEAGNWSGESLPPASAYRCAECGAIHSTSKTADESREYMRRVFLHNGRGADMSPAERDAMIETLQHLE